MTNHLTSILTTLRETQISDSEREQQVQSLAVLAANLNRFGNAYER